MRKFSTCEKGRIVSNRYFKWEVGLPFRRQLHHLRGGLDGVVLQRIVIDLPLLPKNQEKEYGGGEHGFLDQITGVVRRRGV